MDSVEEVEQDRGTGGCDCGDCNCEIEVPTLPTRLNPITLTPSKRDLVDLFQKELVNKKKIKNSYLYYI